MELFGKLQTSKKTLKKSIKQNRKQTKYTQKQRILSFKLRLLSTIVSYFYKKKQLNPIKKEGLKGVT